MKTETLNDGNKRATSNAGNSYILTPEALAALPDTPAELFRALAPFRGQSDLITLTMLVTRDIVIPDPNQRWAGDHVFLFKDTASQSEREINEAIDFALRFAGHDEDDETLPAAYVCEGVGWGVFDETGAPKSFHPTQSDAHAVAATGDEIKPANGWYLSRDDRGPEAGSLSSETLAAFLSEAEADAECAKINAANRPRATTVVLPRGIHFGGFEDRGIARSMDRLFKVYLSRSGEAFEGRGWGEASYGRSGDEGLYRALEDAVCAAGFTDWTIHNATLRPS